jgi:pimeloyl-ACP methyl ester carboxylesterase
VAPSDQLVAAGFQVAVPDQRGYGGSDKPAAIEAYNIIELANDVVGLAGALGHDRFIIVGHDLGAPVAWHTALLHRERVRAVVGMSVPYTRLKVGALTRQENFGDNSGTSFISRNQVSPRPNSKQTFGRLCESSST